MLKTTLVALAAAASADALSIQFYADNQCNTVQGTPVYTTTGVCVPLNMNGQAYPALGVKSCTGSGASISATLDLLNGFGATNTAGAPPCTGGAVGTGTVTASCSTLNINMGGQTATYFAKITSDDQTCGVAGNTYILSKFSDSTCSSVSALTDNFGVITTAPPICQGGEQYAVNNGNMVWTSYPGSTCSVTASFTESGIPTTGTCKARTSAGGGGLKAVLANVYPPPSTSGATETTAAVLAGAAAAAAVAVAAAF